MGLEIANEYAETRNNDEKIEEDDDLDQERHAGHEDLRAEEDPVLQQQQPKDLADCLVSDGENKKTNKLHRQHDCQRQGYDREFQMETSGDSKRYRKCQKHE